VKAVDRRALVLNLLFLRVIALIPFPTALLAEYLRQPGWSGHLAALVFAGLMTAMAVSFCAVWLHTWRRSWSARVSSSSTSQNASRFFTPTAAGHTPERRSDTFTSVYSCARRPVTTGSTTSAVTGALAFVM
jgi:hypothetical protein